MESEKKFLEVYDIESYDRPSVATDIVVYAIREDDSDSFRKDPEKKLSVLMIERGEHPFKNKWALPGGFVRMDETVPQAAIREVKEETGVTPSALFCTGVFSGLSRDPRGRIISNAFTCILKNTESTTAGSDADRAEWFDISVREEDNEYILTLVKDDISLVSRLRKAEDVAGITSYSIQADSPLAFDHAEIILTSFLQLREKAESFGLIFDFLPAEFTLAELQKVQETITGRVSAAANFRRKASEYVEETGNTSGGAGHRPAMLYRKKVQKNAE
ncbi:MAG: NUDIX hydrolase [Ruminiclostridium sp.]|nr:NUDIX hydrolase [Ruminiclostridium sp.]